MNFSFMSFSCPGLDLDSMLSFAKRLGYAGIEPRVQSVHRHGIEFEATPEQRRVIRSKIEDSEIAMCCLATSCKYADPATVDEHVEATHRAVDLAGDLGCKRLRVFGGVMGEGFSRDDAIAQLVDKLGPLAGPAAERGVVICVETHDDWCDPSHLAAVMREVDHPNIAVNWDIMHPVMRGGETMESSFGTLEPWIRHVHVHDGRQDDEGLVTWLPVGEGVVDHPSALQCLKNSGYKGYVSGEWIEWEPAEVHLPRELERLRNAVHPH